MAPSLSSIARALAAGLSAAALLPVCAHAQPTTRLSLADAVALSLQRDADVDRSKRSLGIAALNVATARAGYLPEASVMVSANQSATGSTIRTQDVTFRRGLSGNFVGTVSGSVSLPVDISGSIRRQVEAARLQQDMAALGAESAQLGAVVDVQVAYVSALQAQQMVKIDEAIAASLETLRKEASRKLPAMLPFFDVELAGARETAERSRTISDQAKDGLKLALRLPLDLALELTSDLPQGAAAPAAAAAGDTPEIKAAHRRVDAARLSVERARDFRRPSLRIGAYATQTLSGRFVDEVGRTTNRDYGVNVALNLPILNYDAGRSGNSIRASQLMAEQAEADLETARLASELNIRQARRALDRANERLGQLPDPRAAAAALAAATRALFAAPPETAPALLAQVSNARSSWRSAEMAVLDARAGAIIAALRLSKAVGSPLRLDAADDRARPETASPRA